MGAEMVGIEFQEKLYHQCTLRFGESTASRDTDSKKCKNTGNGEEVGDTFVTSPLQASASSTTTQLCQLSGALHIYIPGEAEGKEKQPNKERKNQYSILILCLKVRKTRFFFSPLFLLPSLASLLFPPLF